MHFSAIISPVDRMLYLLVVDFALCKYGTVIESAVIITYIVPSSEGRKTR